MKYFYAVHIGEIPGVYNSWDECKNYVKNYPNAKFRKFKSKQEAEIFVQFGAIPTKRKKQQNIDSFFPEKNDIKEPRLVSDLVNSLITKEIKHDDLLNKSSENLFKLNPKPTNFDITIYTDGSCINNGQKNASAGIGVYFGENDPRNISEKFTDEPTNQRAELYAVIKALDKVYDDDNYINNLTNITIYTDSDYTIKCITKWIHSWLNNNWINSHGEKVKNKKYIECLYKLTKTFKNVDFKHVRSHTGKLDKHSIGNQEADRLAVAASVMPDLNYKML